MFFVLIFLPENLRIQYKATKCTFVEKETDHQIIRSSNSDTVGSSGQTPNRNLKMKPNNQLSRFKEVTFCCFKTVFSFVTIPVM